MPTSTGAAKALGLVIPELAGRLQRLRRARADPDGSIVDLTVETERADQRREINGTFAGARRHRPLAGILAYSEDPMVSADIVGSPYSRLRRAADQRDRRTQVKVVAWYDNEWGYANRLVELAARVLEPIPAAA